MNIIREWPVKSRDHDHRPPLRISINLHVYPELESRYVSETAHKRLEVSTLQWLTSPPSQSVRLSLRDHIQTAGPLFTATQLSIFKSTDKVHKIKGKKATNDWKKQNNKKKTTKNIIRLYFILYVVLVRSENGLDFYLIVVTLNISKYMPRTWCVTAMHSHTIDSYGIYTIYFVIFGVHY